LIPALIVATFVTLPPEAIAQTARPLGLSIGYPTAVGVLWQPSERIGIRPELVLEFVDAEATSDLGFATSRNSNEFRQVGIGISALFLVHREENLSLYVSPRYVHVRGSNTTERRDAPAATIGFGEESTKTTSHVVAGSLGVRYVLNSRFGVFGEAGIEQHRSTSSDSQFVSRFASTAIRSGVGVVLYF